MHEIKDELELMLKAEIIGRLGHFETQLERQIEDLKNRIATLESGPPPA
ncbi:MAG: hypothetical protein QOD93_4896 [Acetobacteraceae bacterium]|jgi:hypothetical protein|nr:hypothetical protein [Acetobacteraceae bacterium]MEA2771934.1 hypothetical protein [Acetobacteraceae bacterium]